MADVLLKAHGCMRSPGSRVRCSEPLQKTRTGGITMTPAFSQALTIQKLQPNGDMSLAGTWIFLADMNSHEFLISGCADQLCKASCSEFHDRR